MQTRAENCNNRKKGGEYRLVSKAVKLLKDIFAKVGAYFEGQNKQRCYEKRFIKKTAVLAVAAGMMVSATTMTASASSVSGSVSGYSCSGSNFINASGAGAATYGGTMMSLYVKITYQYTDNTSGRIKTLANQNSNNSTSVSARCDRPFGNTRSYRCKSTHTASYGTAWTGTTTYQYY